MSSPIQERHPGSHAGWPPWLVLAPVLIVAGALLGHWFPQLLGQQSNPVWTEPPVAARIETSAPTPALPSLAPIIERFRDGVVRITTRQRQPSQADSARGPRRAVDPSRYQDATDTAAALGVVGGSGFIVHAEGLVVTTHHVIDAHDTIRIEIPGHPKAFDAELLGEDLVSDLAVLRLVDPPSGLRPLSLGDSQTVRQGDWVLSLGNPFEFDQSVSVGIITYVGRHLREERLRVTNEYLQFSAPVNPGDSGAPLLDMAGNVVGLTRRTMTAGRGISFAVPSKSIKTLLLAIQRGDARLRRGYIGLEFRQPRHPEALRGLVEEGSGAEVTAVQAGQPADSAGIRVGDVVLSFEGQVVSRATDLYDWIIEARPGTQKSMAVVREGQLLPPMTVVVGDAGKASSID